MAPHSSVLAWRSPGMGSLAGCRRWGRTESDTTERLHFHFPLSCIGERNGNPLQCSCLENPRDGGAWWAAIDGVAQSRTWLTRLSSSSSKDNLHIYPKQDKNINHLIFSIQSSHEAVGKKIYLCIFTLFQIITLLETDF